MSVSLTYVALDIFDTSGVILLSKLWTSHDCPYDSNIVIKTAEEAHPPITQPLKYFEINVHYPIISSIFQIGHEDNFPLVSQRLRQ